jgi:hypothetical protein
MIDSQPLAVVIRIPNVIISRLELEATLQWLDTSYQVLQAMRNLISLKRRISGRRLLTVSKQ